MIKTVKKYLVPSKTNNSTPHLLRDKSLAVIFSIAFILFGFSLGSSFLLNNKNLSANVLPAVLVDLTNKQRLDNGQNPLAINHLLEKAAMMKAKDMASKNYFDHVSPSGTTPWHWFSEVEYPFVYAGENLAINFKDSEKLENAWVSSPKHYANIINEKFNETGIAVYEGYYQGKEATFVVQLFGARPESKIFQQVKGASISIEQAPLDVGKASPVLLLNDKYFAVAQNINENPIKVLPKENTEIQNSSSFDRFLLNQPKYVQTIYLILIVLIYFVFIAMIVAQIKYGFNIRRISLVIILLCVLAGLSYINSHFVISFL